MPQSITTIISGRLIFPLFDGHLGGWGYSFDNPVSVKWREDHTSRFTTIVSACTRRSATRPLSSSSSARLHNWMSVVRGEDHLVAAGDEPARPVVGRSAGFHHNARWRQVCGELLELFARQPLPFNGAAAVNRQLEYILCQINRYRFTIHDDSSPSCAPDGLHLWHIDAVRVREESITSFERTALTGRGLSSNVSPPCRSCYAPLSGVIYCSHSKAHVNRVRP